MYKNDILYISRFEFDPAKSLANKEKHGIDFWEAQALWQEPILEVPADSDLEERFYVFGKINSRFWTAIITYRGERIRVISVRRSRANEKEAYEKQA